jgi:phosphoribosylglycinamide formyltransferase-1
MMLTLGLLASHRGSNVRAVVEACRSGRLEARPGVVISNNANSGVLEFAAAAEIPARRIGGAEFADDGVRDEAILEELRRHQVDLVLLLGYMKLLGPKTTAAYCGRILNTHPALLPRYGGKGMYGARVHEAVLAAGETETGVTVHLVDEEYDHGDIVAQCRVPVEPGDNVESLSARVLEREHEFLVETLQAIASGAISLPGLPPRFEPDERDPASMVKPRLIAAFWILATAFAAFSVVDKAADALSGLAGTTLFLVSFFAIPVLTLQALRIANRRIEQKYSLKTRAGRREP